MIGEPKYKLGDNVSFQFGKDAYKGIIAVVDPYGVLEDSSDVHYDILADNCLYKHIKETDVTM